MNRRLSMGVLLVATVGMTACSSSSRQTLKTDVQSAVSAVGNAAGDAANNAAEALARTIATQQGEEQFVNAGRTLSGPLTCEATVDGNVTKVTIHCTGTVRGGGAAVLDGSTNEIPGASVTELDGSFTGTVDGQQVFSTQRLGG